MQRVCLGVGKVDLKRIIVSVCGIATESRYHTQSILSYVVERRALWYERHKLLFERYKAASEI